MTLPPEKLLATVRKSDREEFQITRENSRIAIRMWFEADDGSMRPGTAGLAFRASLLDEFIGALQATKFRMHG
jgi:Transcriptional Coactivator p15 (PC4)